MKEVKNNKRPLIFYYVLAMIVLLLLNLLLVPKINSAQIEDSTYGNFLEMLDKGEVKEVQVDSQDSVIYFTDGSGQKYQTGLMNDYKLVDRLYDAGITDFETPIVQQMSPILSFVLSWILPIVVIYFLGMLLMRSVQTRIGGGMGDAMSFGKSNAKVYIKSET